jgi:hypothetical protein
MTSGMLLPFLSPPLRLMASQRYSKQLQATTPMPLDRPNRTRAATALAAYLRGEIDNFKLDQEIFCRTKDRALIDVSIQIWHCYCDIRRHSVHASPESWQFLTRCLAYLHSGVEEFASFRRCPNSAPFPTDSLWHAHQHLLKPDNLPAYDPAKHAQNNYLDQAKHRRDNIIAAILVSIMFLFFLVRIVHVLQ